MFSSKSILIGHSLEHDMKALKLLHSNFIDTAQLFPHRRGLPYKRGLKGLMEGELGKKIQQGLYHDSIEDACSALKLVLLKTGAASL